MPILTLYTLLFNLNKPPSSVLAFDELKCCSLNNLISDHEDWFNVLGKQNGIKTFPGMLDGLFINP